VAKTTKGPQSNSVTFQRRLFVFLLAFVIIMTLSSVTILLVFKIPLIDDKKEIKVSVERELSIFSRDFEARIGDTSVQLVRLSESLSKSIETSLNEENININSLKNHSEVLGKLIEDEFDRLIIAMDRAKSSGVFLVLDATNSPGHPGADNYRAGVCFRISEPDLTRPEMPKRFLRGAPTPDFPDDFMLLSDWEMEFDVKDRSYYHLPLENGRSYWGFESIISQDSTILCSAPIVGTNGTAFGVCGFEISNNFYATHYLPEITGYKQSFCLFTAIGGNGLDIKEGAVLNTYIQPNGKKFQGQHKNIILFNNPASVSPQYVMAILIPKEEIDSHNLLIRGRLVLIIAAILGFGIFVSLLISKKYLHPVLREIDQLYEQIQEKWDSALPGEINELFTPEEIEVVLMLIEGKMRSEISRSLHLSAEETDRRIESIRSKVDSKGDSSPLVSTVTMEFKLTQREKDIFRCLLKNMSNNSISEELFISEGTVKIHVRNVLKKLKLENRRSIMAWSESFISQKGIS